MGRPVKFKPLPRGATRRGFFRRAGVAAATVSGLGALPACGGGGDGDATPAAPAGTVFAHGVASGDPLSDRVILWTRISPANAAAVQVDYVVASGRVSTDASVDYTVKVDALGLAAATTYYYRFTAAGMSSPVGRTRTLPVGAATSLRAAVVCCASLAHGYFNAYGRIAERADLDLVLHLGDYIYEYGDGEYGSARSYEPSHEIITLADYRTRHAQYKRDTDVQAMQRQHAIVAIWDDHEFADNAWSGGATNHTEGAEGTWAARVANALQAYYEWMPVRIVDAANLRKNNRKFSYGTLADLIMLEERVNARSQQVPGNIAGGTTFNETGAFIDPARQLLGMEEESWLTAQLRTSAARWKILGQGVMLSELKATSGAVASGGGVFINNDQWDGYQPARDRLFGVLKGDAANAPVNDVVVLTGDIHSSWAADLTQDPNNADLASGGYDQATGSGSHAVEFVCPAVTSPGLADLTGVVAADLQLVNPQFKYIDLTRRGYMLLDITDARAICEWWYVDTIAATSTTQSFAVAWQVALGTNKLAAAAQTAARPAPPALAP